jgi:hypothetical protein
VVVREGRGVRGWSTFVLELLKILDIFQISFGDSQKALQPGVTLGGYSSFRSNVLPTVPVVCASTDDVGKRSYLEVLVGLGQCTTGTMSLREGYDKPDATVLQVQKANGCGVPGDATNLRFYAGAKCVADHGTRYRGDKDTGGAL